MAQMMGSTSAPVVVRLDWCEWGESRMGGREGVGNVQLASWWERRLTMMVRYVLAMQTLS